MYLREITVKCDAGSTKSFKYFQHHYTATEGTVYGAVGVAVAVGVSVAVDVAVAVAVAVAVTVGERDGTGVAVGGWEL